MSPYGAEGGGITATADSRASVAAASYVQKVGLPFLATASPGLFCSSLESSSNSTVVLGGSIDGHSCGPPPTDVIGSSSLGFALSGQQVEIEAWVAGA